MILLILFCFCLLATIYVQDSKQSEAERVLREQQLRIESLQETNRALRAKPYRT